MDALLKQTLSERFREYVQTFAVPGKETPGPIVLKQEHTFDVCSIMERIAEKEEPDPQRRMLYWLCALFHDVSRFEQYRDFHTFSDDRSFDHGQRSAEIFLRDFEVPGLSEADRRIVHDAVAFHNKLQLPPDMDAQTLGPARAIRDADKISILKLLNRHFAHSLISEEETVNLSLPDSPGFTEELRQKVLHGEPVLYRLMRNVNDFKLNIFGWTADFNYPESARILLEEKIYDRTRTFLPASPELDEMCDVCMARLKRLAEGKRG